MSAQRFHPDRGRFEGRFAREETAGKRAEKLVMSLLEGTGRFQCFPSDPYADELRKIDFQVLDCENKANGRIAVQLKTRPLVEGENVELLNSGIIPLEVLSDRLSSAVNQFGEIVDDNEAGVLIQEMTLAIEEYSKFIVNRVRRAHGVVGSEEILAFIETVRLKVLELYKRFNENNRNRGQNRVFDPV